MSASLWALLLAGLSGAAMAVQGSWNAILGKVIGLLPATLLVHVIGSLGVLGILVFRWDSSSWNKLGEAPWFSFLGGLLGVLIVYGVAASIPKVGVANATTAIIAAQITMAVVIDHFGLFGLKAIPFSCWKALGMALLVTGTRLMLIR